MKNGSLLDHAYHHSLLSGERAENFSYQLYSLCSDNWMQMGRYAAMLWFLCNCMEKAKKVVRKRSMGYKNGVPRDSAYNDGKFSMDTVCVDSTFIETKKGEKIAHTTVTREGKA